MTIEYEAYIVYLRLLAHASMHSLKLHACISVAETMTRDEQKELARMCVLIARGVYREDTLGLELIPFIACVCNAGEHMTSYRDWMQILHAWNALLKQTILVETYDGISIHIFSQHPTLSGALLHDDGSGPKDISVDHFRRTCRHNVEVYYDGMELKTVMANMIASKHVC